MKPEVLKDVLKAVLKSNAGASEAEIKAKCWNICERSPHLISALFDYWFSNSRRDLELVLSSKHSYVVHKMHRPRLVGRRNMNVSTIKQHLKKKLMDFALSDGTLLRFSTFGQASRDGGWLADIAKLGKPNEIIGKKLTEAELQNIRQRHYARNSRVA